MIKDAEFSKLERLAKLNFSEQERKAFTRKLNCAMDMIDNVLNADTEGVEPLASVIARTQPCREDVITEQDNSAILFNNIAENGAELAKQVKCFVVPKVVE